MYGHVLRGDNDDVLGKAFNFKVGERRGRERPNMTWKRKVKEHINEIGLKRKMLSTERSGMMGFTNFQNT